MTQDIYLNQILRGEVATWAPGNWILEEDRDSGHGTYKDELLGIQDGASLASRKRLNGPARWKFDNNIRYLFNVPDSPDMSPIETVWLWITEKIRASESLPMTKKELRDQVQDAWDSIPQEHINELYIGKLRSDGTRVDSIKDRWSDLREAKGDPTGF